MAESANRNLAIRLLTAAIGAPLIVYLLYAGPAWGFYLLALPATLIAAWELFKMTHPADRLSQLMGVAMAAIVSGVVYLSNGDARVLTTMIICVPLAGPILTLLRLGD